jgi:outer membrane PBP1 activator LpoA protein
MGLCVAADNEASAAQTVSDAPARKDAQPIQLALLLPLASPDFARVAEALRLGFLAASKRSGEELSIGVIATSESNESIVAGYESAVQRGARLVVGPMTRSGVSALAASRRASLPTLGLNQPEDKIDLPPRFYTLGLALEAEAQLVAHTAFAENFKSAILVSAKTPLAQRSRNAFSQAWLQFGGTIKASYEFDPQTDYVALKETLSTAAVDMIFLAADAEQARAARPYLNNNIAVFATSQVNSERSDALANVDLNGIRFVEMPWLVQPDHPAVMIYPREEGMAADAERFYALGIDAFRVAAALLKNPRALNLDGVTGKLKLFGSHIEREPIQAVFRNGAGVAFEDER